MTFAQPNFVAVLPEIFVLSMACVVLLVGVYQRGNSPLTTYLLTQATLFGALILTVSGHSTESMLTFSDMFVKDSMGDVLKIFIYLTAFIAFLYSRHYLYQRGLLRSEYFVLGLFSVLGMMVMVSANSLLTVYLGLELLSLCLYAMVALNRDSPTCSEAAMKFFILGALASGLLLYGMSLFYGATGTLILSDIKSSIGAGVEHSTVLRMGVVFIVVGIAFKLGSVPFHMWVPDVYHGAPTAVTLFLSTAPKIAAFGMAMRLLVDGLGGLHIEWQSLLIILAMLSIAIGNVIAIAQTNIKRMLAYSTISHMGFLLIGILTGTSNGYASAMFYTLVYTVMGLGSFGMVILLSRAGFEAENLEDFKGLNDRSPWFAFSMLIIMFSMAGVPPTVGFFAKLSVLQAAVEVHLTWLAIFAVIFSVIGAFYYLRIIKLMYFDKPVDTTPIVCGPDMKLTLSVNSMAILLLGMFPGMLMALCSTSLMR